MRITLQLRNPISRIAVCASVTLGVAAFISLCAARFVISVITDPEARAEAEIIEGAANYFPNSASAQARIAAHYIESSVDVSEGHEQTAERAFNYAARAVALAPHNYEYRTLLGAAKELRGDLAGAEAELREALKLAPYRVTIHWRLANLLIRQGKTDQASAEFRLAGEADPELLIPALNILWQATDGKTEPLNAAVGGDPRSRLTLAHFLVEQEKFEPAVEIANGLDRRLILNLPESGKLIDSLISKGRIDMANKLWRSFLGGEDKPLIWNESFESPVRSGLVQFDWNLGQSKYARIGITTTAARTGQHSLKISYNGVNTTSFDNEIRQLFKIRPGAHYDLTCYVKAEKLVTPDGPRVAVTLDNLSTPVASSAVIEAGTYDWRLLTMDFVAPPDVQVLVVTIKQKPQFSYVEPTSGTVWFDDFALKEKSSDLK
jgi:tetratricopeptide repeat protein